MPITTTIRRASFLIPLIGTALALLPVQAQEFDQPAARLRWFVQQRAGPDGRLPGHLRLKALLQARSIMHAQTQGRPAGAAAVAGQWTSIGPQSFNIGPHINSGRVTALAIDPTNPDIVYAGASDGGVWKTVDGGTTWIPLTDNQLSLSIGALAIDPSNSQIVYAGTGEANFCTDCYFGVGILKSTDGGVTWTNIQAPFVDSLGRGAHIGSIAVHPQNTKILLAAVNEVGPLSEGGNVAIPGGIYRSTDAGITWSLTYGSGATPGGSGGGLCTPDVTCASKVIFNPLNPSQAFAAVFGRGVFVSNDTGATWQPSNGTGNNLISLANVGRVELAMAASNPLILYVTVSNMNPEIGTLLGVYKTTDGGQNWAPLPGLLPIYCGIQCWNANVLAVDPTNPNVVLAGGVVLWRSTDGGATWADTSPSNVVLVDSPHADHHALEFAKGAVRLYDGNDGGIWSTVNPQQSAISWKNLNASLTITQFYPSLSIHPGDLNFSFGGAQDNGTQRYSGTLTWDSVACGDGGWTAIDPSVSGTIYGACQDIEIRKSVDGGNTWTLVTAGIDLTDRVAFMPPLVMDPSNPKRLYFGTYRLWRSDDGAGAWKTVSSDLTGVSSSSAGAPEQQVDDDRQFLRGTDYPTLLQTIAVAPSDSQTVYTGAGSGLVYVTTSADGSDPNRWVNRSQGLPPRFVSQIQVDPGVSTTAYVSFSGFTGLAAGDTQGHIFRTRDGGNTWVDISGNLPNIPVSDIQLDPDLPSTIYAATDVGVFVTSNAGQSWNVLGAGLPRVVVMGLRLHRATRTLRAATHGRGMWDILVPLPTGTNPAPGLRSATPANASPGSPDLIVTLNGAAFLPTTSVLWNGKSRAITPISASQLSVTIPAAELQSPLASQFIAMNPGPGGGVSNALTFPVLAKPVVNANGVVNAASYSGIGLAAGMVASIFGTNLAVTTGVAPSLPLPTTLNDVQVTFNGVPAPLFFVSPQQINFQIPWASAPATAPVVTTVFGVSSDPQTAPTFAVSPGIFSLDQTGTGQGAVLIANSPLLAGPASLPGARPAAKGEAISIYCTGLGFVTPAQQSGFPAPLNPPATAPNKPTVSIGGVPATVLFSGLAPGFVGLYQLNVTVPSNAPSGDAIPLTITAVGRSANTVTIAVQ